MKRSFAVTVLVLSLAIAFPAAAYDDEDYTPPKDDSEIRFDAGYQGSTTEDALHHVAEYDVVEPEGLAALEFQTSLYAPTLVRFRFERLGSKEGSGAAELDLERKVRVRASMDGLIHRLDHDPLTNLQAVSDVKVVQHTDLDPGREYDIRYRNYDVRADFRHPAVPGFSYRVGFREQQRHGMKQLLTTSHCTSCHTTSQGQEVDSSTTEFEVGAHLRRGRYDVDYQIQGRYFQDNADMTTARYEGAYRPAPPPWAGDPTVLPVPFNDRIWFQKGDFPVQNDPQTRRTVHKLKLRGEMRERDALSFTALQSKTENRDTSIDYDMTALRAKYTLYARDALRVHFYARHDEIESSDYNVDLLALNGIAAAPVSSYSGFGPLSYQDWINAAIVPARGDQPREFERFRRLSTLDRDDDRIGVNVYWKPWKRASLKLGYRFRTVERENVLLLDGTGQTDSNRLSVAYNQRFKNRLRWNNSLVVETSDNPYVNDVAAWRRFAGFSAPGVVLGASGPNPSPKKPTSLQYVELHELRGAALGTSPSDAMRLRSSATWSPSGHWSVSGNLRYRTEKNDELRFLDETSGLRIPLEWERNSLGIGANVWYAAGPAFSVAIGVDHLTQESDSIVSIPLMDG